jgi:hypothetical protein
MESTAMTPVPGRVEDVTGLVGTVVGAGRVDVVSGGLEVQATTVTKPMHEALVTRRKAIATHPPGNGDPREPPIAVTHGFYTAGREEGSTRSAPDGWDRELGFREGPIGE